MVINKKTNKLKRNAIKNMRLGELVDLMINIKDYQERINPLAKLTTSVYAKTYSKIRAEINKREELYKK